MKKENECLTYNDYVNKLYERIIILNEENQIIKSKLKELEFYIKLLGICIFSLLILIIIR